MSPTRSPPEPLDPPLERELEPELDRELEELELDRELALALEDRDPLLNDCPPPGRIEKSTGGATE
ncbi:MAG: hypothetical protein ABW133_12355 [Polyangiaceae bacterium]